MHRFSKLPKISALSVSFSLLLALACVLVVQSVQPVDLQPTSFAKSILHTVTVNNALVVKRIADNKRLLGNNLLDDWPQSAAVDETALFDWSLGPLVKPQSNRNSSFKDRGYFLPQLRAPPLV